MGNLIVQGDLVGLEERGNRVQLTIIIERDIAVSDRNRDILQFHLGVVSVGQGITAYHQLKEARVK